MDNVRHFCNSSMHVTLYRLTDRHTDAGVVVKGPKFIIIIIIRYVCLLSQAFSSWHFS